MNEKVQQVLIWFQALSLQRKLLLGAATVICCFVILVASIRLAVSLEWIDDLPDQQELLDIESPLASELYASNQKLIGKYYRENRSSLSFDQLNEYFKNALVATEDVRFYKHNGVDTKSLLRVLGKTILLRKDASGGGSTLTQQLVKNLYPRKRYKLFSMLINKFREMSIAKRLEKVYDKDQILLMYANTVSFGERAFGLRTAAKRFFNKQPEELTLGESATLVGILKATSYYSPRKHPERAEQRRNVVLSQMHKYEYIDSTQQIEAKELPLTLDYQAPSASNELARYFKQHIQKEFINLNLQKDDEDEETDSQYDLLKDGLKIYTTLDFDLQVAAEKIMQSHMKWLQGSFDESWKGGKKFGKDTKIIDDKILSDAYYKSLRAEGLSNKDALQKFTIAGDRNIWTWSGTKTLEATKIDSIKHYLSLLHTGVLAAHPKTGAIKVWIGGNDYSKFQWDNILSPRQVGSTFKPIVYLASLEQGKEPCDFYKNELRSYNSYEDWTPRNADGKYGGYASMQGALTHSINTISVQLLFETGIPKVVDLAKRLGIRSKLNAVPSIVLGTSDISLYEMVEAYAVLANEGRKEKFYTIEKIEDKHGKIIYQHADSLSNESQQNVVSIDAVKKLNDMLTNVTRNGTGRRLYANYHINEDIKGKTGTTQNQSDGWFIGYTDDLVIGAWVGAQDRRIHFRTLGTGSGGRTALPMVAALFEKQTKVRPQLVSEDWDHLATTCPDTLSEESYAYYLRRNERELTGERIAGGLFDFIFGKRKRNDSKVNSRERRRQEKMRKDREERIKKYNKAKKEWEKRLKELKKKYGEG